LAPGSYQFRGRYKLNLRSERGLLWRIRCVNKSNNGIGESLINGDEPKWKDFGFSFTVPNDCPAQSIQLILDARSASERFVSGSAWFDDFQIDRELSGKISVENSIEH
jgi:hypothetical protein